MVHDLFASFFCRSDDKEPKYRCPVGLFSKGEDFLVKKGFRRVENPYYQDYEKDVSKTDLQEWVRDGYVYEVMDVIYCGEDFEKILLEALMVEPIDDIGTLPERMVQLNGVSVIFSNTDPTSPVRFQGESGEDSAGHFTINLHSLKNIFGVLTLMEVMSSIQKFGEGLNWTLEQWGRYFKEKGLTLQQ